MFDASNGHLAPASTQNDQTLHSSGTFGGNWPSQLINPVSILSQPYQLREEMQLEPEHDGEVQTVTAVRLTPV